MNKQIGFTSLTVKAVDNAKRMIRGIATTPTPDRVNDVVEPLGITFKNPAVLLWMHRHDQPVGSVTFGKPTAKGVPFEATFPEISAPSQLAARVEEAFQSCLSGLIRHVSIGFRPIEYSVIQETGGLRFTKSEVYELSLVSVPAQPDASFEVVKAFDAEIRASMGGEDEASDKPSGSTETKPKLKSVKLTPKEAKNMSIAEKLKDFKAELATKSAEMNGMMEKSMESGETFDSAQEEKYETLKGEVDALQKHIERAEQMLKSAAKTATPVDGSTEAKAKDTRQGFQVKPQPKLEKGIEFARLAMCKFASQGNAQEALNIAKTQYGTESGVAKALELETGGRKIEQIMKATVEAGTTLDATWAAPLVEYQNFAGDFVEFLRPRTILGQFGQGNVPSLRRIPFNVRIPAQTSGGAAYWVGEGAPKPLTSFDFTSTEHRWNKVASIAVLTEELIRFSDPSAERLVRDSLADAVIARTDIDFIDPAKALVANVSPASITNGATAIPSRGPTAEDVRCDLMDKKAWKMANPGLGLFRSEKDLEEQLKEAQRLPSKENSSRNLLLNQRIAGEASFVSRTVWEDNGAEPEPMFKKKVYGGLDLSSVSDLTGLVLVSEDGDVDCRAWLPKEGIIEKSKQDRVPYDVWAKSGELLTTPGKAIEYEYVAYQLKQVFEDYEVLQINFDRYNMKFLHPWLKKAGLTDVQIEKFKDFGQGMVSMSPALRELEMKLLQKKLKHGMNPVLTMCMGNARVETDAAGNRKFTKKKSTGRIDLAVCMAMAVDALAKHENNQVDYSNSLFFV